jgi:hypothetical protein
MDFLPAPVGIAVFGHVEIVAALGGKNGVGVRMGSNLDT